MRGKDWRAVRQSYCTHQPQSHLSQKESIYLVDIMVLTHYQSRWKVNTGTMWEWCPCGRWVPIVPSGEGPVWIWANCCEKAIDDKFYDLIVNKTDAFPCLFEIRFRGLRLLIIWGEEKKGSDVWEMAVVLKYNTRRHSWACHKSRPPLRHVLATCVEIATKRHARRNPR